MFSCVIPTKLRPPEPAGGRLDRPRLDRVLRQATQRRCTLLVAAAGWGKTCALAQLRNLDSPLVWYSLDRADGDPAVLAAHLLAGFDAAFPGLAERVRAAGPGDPAAVIAQLAAGLAERNDLPVVVAFDDLHHLAGRSGGMRLLTDFLTWAPPGVRVAAAGRRLPPWPLARLKAGGGLSIIGQDVLAFTAEEAAAFLERLAAHPPAADELASLMARTEGWPAALRLLAQGWSENDRQDRSPADWLRNYVRQEILATLAPGDRRLLMAAALLERFDGELLDEVLGSTGSTRALDRLARRGALLMSATWDDGSRRFHHLLQDVLQERTREELDAGQLREWHRRAGDARRRRGDHREAVEHFLRAGDDDAAAAAIEDLARFLPDLPALDTMERWLARLGPEQRRRPGIRFLAGQLAHRRGRHRESLPELRAALTLYRASGQRSGLAACGFLLTETLVFLDQADAVLDLAQVLRSEADAADWRKLRVNYPIGLALKDRFEEAVADWRAAEADAPCGEDDPDLGRALRGAYANYILLPLGRLDEARALIEGVVADLGRRDVSGRLAMNLAFLAHAWFDLGRWREARDTMEEAIRVALERGWPGFVPSMRLMLARIAVAAGDGDAGPLFARALASRADEAAAGMYRGYFMPVVAAVLAARAGDTAARDREAARARRALEPLVSAYLRGEALLELAPAHLEAGDFGQAAALAGEVLEMTRALPTPYLRARAHLLLAAARAGVGDEAGARSARSQAVEAAASCGQEEALRRREARLLERLAGLVDHRPPASAAAGENRPGPPAAPATAARPGAKLHIRSLGHLEVRADGRAVRWRRPRDRQVFKFLLTAYPNAVPRDLLIDTFWPDLDWPAALANLHNAVSQARRALEAAGADGSGRIAFAGGAYRLALEPGDLWDVEEVRRLDPAVRDRDAAAARRLVTLARGDYLAEDRYADWAEPVRQEVAAARRRALRVLREAAQAGGEREEALAWAEALVREDPLSEGDQVRLMTLLALCGRRDQALARYRRYVRELDESLGLPPSPAVEALVRSLLAGDPQPVPPDA